MAGELMAAEPQAAPEPQGPVERPPVSDQDDKLAKDYLRRIEAAKSRPAFKEAVDRFKDNRKLLRGFDPVTKQKMRANLHFANLAMMRPQVYAKDPEYSVKPTAGVSGASLEKMKAFAETCEAVLGAELVKGCKLKKLAKRMLTASFTTAVGWWKLGFQEDKRTDPVVDNQIKDTQDELMRVQSLRDQINDPQACSDTDLKLAELKQTLAGLASKSEIVIGRGLVLDFVLSEDILILDASVRELGDYPRSSAMAERIWMTRSAFRTRWGFEPKGKIFADVSGNAAVMSSPNSSRSSEDDLFELFEVWDQDKSRVFHVCTGEKGFLQPPISPDWTGERWLPFFALLFNETDGDLFPLSDIELTEPLVREYNEARDDLVKDRRDTRPFTVVRKGGTVTEKDAQNVANRDGGVVLIEGVGNSPLGNDIQGVQLGKIDPANYNTQPARADIEQIIGGGDAARGSVMEAKTATEAEILSQGLRGRSAERQDIMEDLLTDVGIYALQVCLRKLTKQDVAAIVGEQAAQIWPEATPIDQIFRQITLDVRGGSTGKPDRLQDQDRWTKLLPVIEKTIEQVSDLRAKGQDQLAEALITLTRETLRRFDERLDIEQFLPAKDPNAAVDPAALTQENQQLKQQLQENDVEASKQKLEQEKLLMDTTVALATAPDPLIAFKAFELAYPIVQQAEQSGNTGRDPGALMQSLMQQMAQRGQQPGQPGQPPQPATPPADPGSLPISQADPTQSGPDQPQPQ